MMIKAGIEQPFVLSNLKYEIIPQHKKQSISLMSKIISHGLIGILIIILLVFILFIFYKKRIRMDWQSILRDELSKIDGQIENCAKNAKELNIPEVINDSGIINTISFYCDQLVNLRNLPIKYIKYNVVDSAKEAIYFVTYYIKSSCKKYNVSYKTFDLIPQDLEETFRLKEISHLSIINNLEKLDSNQKITQDDLENYLNNLK